MLELTDNIYNDGKKSLESLLRKQAFKEVQEVLEEKGIDAEVVKYLDTPPSKEEIVSVLKMLGITARELMRTKEDIYKELKLKEEYDYDKLVDAMVENPKLIETCNFYNIDFDDEQYHSAIYDVTKTLEILNAMRDTL